MDHGYDLYPLDTLAAKPTFVKQAIERGALVFFETRSGGDSGLHQEEAGKPRVVPA